MGNRFVIIAPTYNAEKTVSKAILSLAAQSYENWKLVVIDDMSTDDTQRTILQLAHNLGFHRHASPTNKVEVISNKEKKWEIANTLEGLKRCNDDDIVVRFDMDDYLVDNRAFEIINAAYTQHPELDAAWTAHCWFDDEHGISSMNISKDLPKGVDPYKHPWVSSHLKTFRKSVLNNVKDENYRGQDGNYFRRIGDQAFMLPALQNARQWAYIPFCAYAYRCSLKPETFQTEDAKFQAAEAAFLRSRGYVK